MKREDSIYIRIIIICGALCIILVSGGYFYINKNITSTENNVSSVPYTAPVPENCGIILNISNTYTFFYLDFYNSRLSVLFTDEQSEKNKNIYGYSVNYNIKADYSIIAKAIDIINGIDLKINNQTYRYTGIQISEMLEADQSNNQLRRDVVSSISQKISKVGVEKKLFSEIVEEYETNLTIPDCYYWSDYLKNLCGNTSIIN